MDVIKFSRILFASVQVQMAFLYQKVVSNIYDLVLAFSFPTPWPFGSFVLDRSFQPEILAFYVNLKWLSASCFIDFAFPNWLYENKFSPITIKIIAHYKLDIITSKLKLNKTRGKSSVNTLLHCKFSMWVQSKNLKICFKRSSSSFSL